MQQRSARDPSRKKKSFFREGQLPQELYGRRMRPIGPRVLPVGIYFKKFINLFKKGNTPDKTSINSGLESLKNILNLSENGKNLLNDFLITLSKEKEQIAFYELFPDSTDVEKTTYPKSIQIGDQTLH